MSHVPRRASLPAEQTRQYRNSVGTNAGTHREDIPYTSDDFEYDDPYPQTPPRSAIRYQTREQVLTQGNKRLVIHNEPPPSKKAKPYWLVYMCCGMLLMALAWIALTCIGNWWTNQQNAWAYGFPRTFQTDALVDATTPSHFIAVNIKSHVEVVEFPGGDATKAKVYIGPTLYGNNSDLDPVTLTFKDINGDGKPDMIIHVLDQNIVFLNTGTEFKQSK